MRLALASTATGVGLPEVDLAEAEEAEVVLSGRGSRHLEIVECKRCLANTPIVGFEDSADDVKWGMKGELWQSAVHTVSRSGRRRISGNARPGKKWHGDRARRMRPMRRTIRR